VLSSSKPGNILAIPVILLIMCEVVFLCLNRYTIKILTINSGEDKSALRCMQCAVFVINKLLINSDPLVISIGVMMLISCRCQVCFSCYLGIWVLRVRTYGASLLVAPV